MCDVSPWYYRNENSKVKVQVLITNALMIVQPTASRGSKLCSNFTTTILLVCTSVYYAVWYSSTTRLGYVGMRTIGSP